MGKHKISISNNKKNWHPSPLLGQIVLVNTIDGEGRENIAPKSWVQMMAFSPPTVVLGCNLNHRTAKNILETKEFTINTVDEKMAGFCWELSESTDRLKSIKDFGLTLLPSLKVSPSRIHECKAHIECTLSNSLILNNSEGDVALFGEIVSVSVDEVALEGDLETQYSYLNPVLYLEERLYGTLASALKIVSRDKL
jgi:flavin reductase (DIM6/NTAB) family NADH-FMN oxidoreductase RutF